MAMTKHLFIAPPSFHRPAKAVQAEAESRFPIEGNGMWRFAQTLSSQA
jgi:hypothetical protein